MQYQHAEKHSEAIGQHGCLSLAFQSLLSSMATLYECDAWRSLGSCPWRL